MPTVRILTVAMAIGLATQPVGTREQSSASQPIFREGTLTVAVDVVVRDGRGRPVLDLQQGDFDVREDGVRQAVLTFEGPRAASAATLGATRQRAGPAGNGAPALGLPGNAAAGPDIRTSLPTALVFHRLPSQSRQRAYAASLAYIQAQAEQLPPTGIFVLEPHLHVAQDFTTDAARLGAGLDSMRRRANWEYSYRLASSEDDAERALRQVVRARASGESALAPPSWLNDGDRFYQLERVQAGYAALSGLRAIVKAMAGTPGRKGVALFSEGLVAARDLEGAYARLIAEANRANVSFYIVDSEGLRTVSNEYLTSQQIQSAAQAMLNCDPSVAVCSARPATGPSTDPDTDARMFDPDKGLARLAEETGGAYVSARNDLDAALRRMGDDRRHHYILSYASTNSTLDGTFRALEVRVRRRGATVASRRGYLASRLETSKSWNASENPARVALDTSPLPNAFPSTLDVVRMPSQDGVRAAVLVDVAIEHLTGALDPSAPPRSAVIIARVRSLTGQVLQTFSQRYELRGTPSAVPGAPPPRLRFLCAPRLPPGPYTLESAVHDEVGRRSSVRVKSLDIPHDWQFPAGDVFLVSHVSDAKREEIPEGHPFLTGGQLVHPLVGARVSRAMQTEVIVAVPLGGGAGGSRLTVRLVRPEGTPLETTMPVEGGLARFGIQLFRIPVEALRDGPHHLQVSGLREGRRWNRDLRLTVMP